MSEAPGCGGSDGDERDRRRPEQGHQAHGRGREVEASTDTDVQERHEKLTEDVDAILDEIDDVLEENAEEFVRGYVQKGGQ